MMDGRARRQSPWTRILIVCAVLLVFAILGVTALKWILTLFSPDHMHLEVMTGASSWRVYFIADHDVSSKVKISGKHYYYSTIKTCVLGRSIEDSYSIQLGAEHNITSGLNEAERGMELSDLLMFHNKLYSVDDRSGAVFELNKDPKGQWQAVPRTILTDGDGESVKGFKGEWMTLKDGHMYIGGMGKEWVQGGKAAHRNPEYVKLLNKDLVVTSLDWGPYYQRIRKYANASWPGYIIHEAVCFNQWDRHWYFLPRRISTEMYDEEKDELMASNMVFVLNEDMSSLAHFTVDLSMEGVAPGFSSCTFINARHMIAVLSREYQGEVGSWVIIFNVEGNVLLSPKYLGDSKFEGVEIDRRT
eukprot:gnl/Spiro4/20756_TR10111_c0_g1_i1.p1 gnl/Spiro4/20756_TR10111_c0_g1~~gnl/Spiro4/20756_TR10111_c0_g1_i1.p1  ORF type:complete len:378 (-),score=94.06 gnl/Spiro4/20756_TR10111_c0_g1_i1:117-1193(-)